MGKRTIPLIAIAALAALPALGGVAGAAPTVTVGNNFFKPAEKRIGQGAVVRFSWVGGRRHNVTKASGPGAFFESRTTRRAGVNFSKRFRRAGTYRLYCTLHPAQMRLKLVVG